MGKWSQGSKNTLAPTLNSATNANSSQNSNSYKAINYSPDKKRNLFQPSTPNIPDIQSPLPHSPPTPSIHHQHSLQQIDS